MQHQPQYCLPGNSGSCFPGDSAAESEWQLLEPLPEAGRAPLVMEIVDLTCFTAQKSVIVRNLSIALRRGESALILGPSGVGKSTLLRALKGIWPCQARSLRLSEEVSCSFGAQLYIEEGGNHQCLVSDAHQCCAKSVGIDVVMCMS